MIKYVAALALLGALLAGPGASTASATADSPESAMVGQIIDQINAERTNRGLAPLPASHELNASAQAYAERWPTVSGCATSACHSGTPGELIYFNTGDAPSSAATRWWMNSTGHRQAMLGTAQAIGVGIECRTGGGFYAVVHLGSYSAAASQPVNPIATPAGSGSTCTTPPSQTASQPQMPSSGFWDVADTSVFADAVGWATDAGITNGCGDSLFCTSHAVSRAQVATYLWRAAGSPAASGPQFDDVAGDAYYADAVRWSRDRGITTGCSSSSFCPEGAVGRAQMVTFLWRAAGSPDVGANHGFGDVPRGVYYEDAVTWAVKAGVTTGTTATTFSPDDLVTRGQAVVFLHRAQA